MFIRFILITSIIFIQSAIALTDFDHPLTIPELIDIALENHPSTRQVWWNAHRAVVALGSAKSTYYPQIGLEAHAEHGRDFKFINGPDTTYTIVGANLIASLMLYDFGERTAAIDEAKMSLLAANWQSDWNIQKVLIKVLENAYLTLYAQEVLELHIISLNEAEKILRAANELKRVGLRSISDIYTSQASVYQMKMDLARQRSVLDIQKGKLAASLGLPANTSLMLAHLDPIQLPEKEQIDALIALSNYQRADLMAKYTQLRESYARLNKVRSSFRPKLSLSCRGGIDRAIHDKADGASYQISLNLEMPLFNGFKNIYDNRLAYADMKFVSEDLSELQLNISLEVLMYRRLLEAAQEMLPYAEESLKNAIDAYQSVLERYKAGKEAITEIFILKKQLSEARMRYSEVKMQWLVAIANLAYATGTMS